MRQLTRAAGCFLVAALALAGAAAADWLVTKQGDRIETRGAWRRQGAMVVFTLPNGTLSSLRAGEIDFDASARASAAPAPSATPAPEAKKKPVLVLKDKDVAHVAAEGDAAENGGPAAAAKGGAEGQAAVAVINWHQDLGENGLVVSGSVQNNDPKRVATDLVVEVRLFDAKGKLIVSGPASLSAATLPPGKTATFSATFPNTERPAALKFGVTNGFTPAPPAEPQ